MTTRSFSFAINEFYHIYNRGVDKRIIYQDAEDYERFTELLYAANTLKPTDLREIKLQNTSVYDWEQDDRLVAIGAYCLMPNHFHILLSPLQEGGISTFMNKLGTSYSMYFNKKYKRRGTLYEGKFKAKHADTDEYLKYLFSYIHLNPIKLIQPDWRKQGVTDHVKAYTHASTFKYSSLLDYLLYRQQSVILEKETFPNYFASAAKQRVELMEWLQYDVK